MSPTKKISGKAGSNSHCCETVIAAAGNRSHRPQRRGIRALLQGFFTANETAEMRLSATICTANIADVADGGWAVIAPYGDHPSPDGSYSQHFDRAQAEKVVKTWNSITGAAVRWFKNLAHGLGAKFSAPVWDGHPDSDGQRWPVEKLLAEITDVRTGNDGLEGRVKWNAKTANARPAGPLFPSALWWHWPASGVPPTVYPEVLESVGLVRTPNISGVPAWTQNALALGGATNLAGNPQAENQNQNNMTPQELAALRKALGLPETADAAACIARATTANAAVVTLAEREGALTTANSTISTLNGERDTLRTQHGALVTERDGLKTANASLTTERDTLKTANAMLVKGILDVSEKRGVITPAERPAFETRITTANTAADALTELQTRKPALNTQAVEINGNRVDLTTANARMEAIGAAVQKRMADHKLSYDDAFAAVQKDPALAALFSPMPQP